MATDTQASDQQQNNPVKNEQDQESQGTSGDQSSDASTTSTLEEIAKGETGKLKIPDNSIVDGKRIRNDVLRALVGGLRDDGKLKDDQILDTLLVLDQAVEAEKMTNEVLKTINSNPDFFKKLDLTKLKGEK